VEYPYTYIDIEDIKSIEATTPKRI
jgi:hypothetical protein